MHGRFINCCQVTEQSVMHYTQLRNPEQTRNQCRLTGFLSKKRKIINRFYFLEKKNTNLGEPGFERVGHKYQAAANPTNSAARVGHRAPLRVR